MNIQRTDSSSHRGRISIKVVGVGGAGSNDTSRMARSLPRGAEVVCVITDFQALQTVNFAERIAIGTRSTGYLGAGGNPDLGRRAADEDAARLEKAIKDSDLVFIAAGLGGGTGTGAAPVVARLARRSGALTIGVVNTPFGFEGEDRAANARNGLEKLVRECDSLAVLSNDRLLSIIDPAVGLDDAFACADRALETGVGAIASLMMASGVVNVDFADLRSVLEDGGRAHIGVGTSRGPAGGSEAAAAALESALVDQPNLHSATRVIVNVSGGCDLSLGQVSDAVACIRAAVNRSARFFMGVARGVSPDPEVSVTVVAAGMSAARAKARRARRQPVEVETPVLLPLEMIAEETALPPFLIPVA